MIDIGLYHHKASQGILSVSETLFLVQELASAYRREQDANAELAAMRNANAALKAEAEELRRALIAEAIRP